MRWSGLARGRLELLLLPVAPLTLVACSGTFEPDDRAQHTVQPFLARPFEGDFELTNVFDHDLPLLWDDANGVVVAWWGDTIDALDGHEGYDWLMPEGTALRAAAGGIVTRAGLGSQTYCPPLRRRTRGGVVGILHLTPEGESYMIFYSHVSRSDVSVGDIVEAGQQVALSGDTGCSTDPHLHFQVEYRRRDAAPAPPGALSVPAERSVAVDPYGWEGSRPDPWSTSVLGARSQWLWLEGQAPEGRR
jgi:murein DD-endopeptidase MepM/ murein hydrolase activator NlpD